MSAPKERLPCHRRAGGPAVSQPAAAAWAGCAKKGTTPPLPGLGFAAPRHLPTHRSRAPTPAQYNGPPSQPRAARRPCQEEQPYPHTRHPNAAGCTANNRRHSRLARGRTTTCVLRRDLPTPTQAWHSHTNTHPAATGQQQLFTSCRSRQPPRPQSRSTSSPGPRPAGT